MNIQQELKELRKEIDNLKVKVSSLERTRTHPYQYGRYGPED